MARLILLLSVLLIMGFGIAETHIHSVKMDISPQLLEALIQTESSGDPSAFNKGSGARGLTQITPIAWQDLLAHYPKKYSKLNYQTDIFKPEVARMAGTDYLGIINNYLRAYKLQQSLENLLGAYNWGIGNVRKLGIEKAPPETINYITKIKGLLKQ